MPDRHKARDHALDGAPDGASDGAGPEAAAGGLHVGSVDSGADALPDSVPAQLDPDGNDELVGSPTPGALPSEVTFVAVGKPPLGWQRICDMRAFAGKLYLAHANQPLGTMNNR